jgi:hypothetical protein
MNTTLNKLTSKYFQRRLLNQISRALLAILITITIWLLAHELNHALFDFAYTTPLISAIFIPAGVRVVIVICFGWAGAVGLMLGYLITAHFHHGLPVLEILPLALLAGLTPYLGYRIWLKITKQPQNFLSLKLKDIFLLTVLCSILNALSRSLVLSPANDPHSFEAFLIILSGNLIGSLAFFYMLIFALRIFRVIAKRIAIE